MQQQLLLRASPTFTLMTRTPQMRMATFPLQQLWAGAGAVVVGRGQPQQQQQQAFLLEGVVPLPWALMALPRHCSPLLPPLTTTTITAISPAPAHLGVTPWLLLRQLGGVF